MKAAVCRAFGAPLTIEEVSLRPPARGEVRVRIAACAICHSDIAYANGAWGGTLPLVLGHEASGHVDALGPEVTGFSVGDRVLVTLIRACGACPACAQGAPTNCDHAWNSRPSPISNADGPLTQGMSTGAFAEAVVVDQSQVVPLSDGIGMDVACLISCGVITGVGAVLNTARVQPGQSVVVIGAGGVGLNTLQGARLAGAGQIIAVDIADARLQTARAFGATDGVRGDAPDHVAQVRALTGGRGADHVFVAVGIPQVFETAMQMLCAGGAMVMVGMPPSDAQVRYNPGDVAAMNQRMLGSRMGQSVPHRDIPWLLEQYHAGKLELDSLVTGRYPLTRINEAIAETRAGRALRNVIVFD
jgi:Zn-dependent alcohol dehydrogenase